MSDQFIRIEGLDQLKKIEETPDIIARTLKKPQLLREIGTVMVASGEQTLTEGGRPVKYKPLAASTIAHKGSSKPLIDKGTLRNSLDYEVQGGDLYLTSVEYLKYHQFEKDRTTAKFPARPVWGVQEEDMGDITDIILDNVSESL